MHSVAGEEASCEQCRSQSPKAQLPSSSQIQYSPVPRAQTPCMLPGGPASFSSDAPHPLCHPSFLLRSPGKSVLILCSTLCFSLCLFPVTLPCLYLLSHKEGRRMRVGLIVCRRELSPNPTLSRTCVCLPVRPGAQSLMATC